MAGELDTQSFLTTKAGIIRALASSMIYDAIEIGKHLTEVQERLANNGDGGFVKWLADEFEWSQRHAYNFITLFKTYGNEGVLQRVANNWSIKALLTLAKPDVPDDVRVNILKQDKRVTEKEVKEIIAKAKAQQIEANNALMKAGGIMEKAKDRMAEAEYKIAEANQKEAELRDSYNQQIKNLQKKHTAELYELQRKFNHRPTSSDFEEQTNRITGPLVTIIQHDELAKMLSELEHNKEDIINEFDLYNLDRVIHALESLSKRAKSWSERLTPTNEKWENRPRKV